MSIQCLVVDDEMPARGILKNFIGLVPSLILVHECSNALQATDCLHKNKIDLIFLDIKMPMLSGIDFAKTLVSPPAIILTTAFADYALESYDIGIIDYLLKPFSFERFLKAVNKVVKLKELSSNVKDEPETPFLFLKSDREIHKVNFAEILFFEANGNYVKVVMSNKYLLVTEKISSIETLVANKGFVRVHRSYIVSLTKINKVTNQIVLVQKHSLPIGGLYQNSFKDAFGTFIQSCKN